MNYKIKKEVIYISIYAFILNFIWEMLQMPFYKNMHWDVQSTLYCFVGTIGDVFMIIIIFFSVGFLVKDISWIENLDFKKKLFVLFLGLVLSIPVEQIALSQDLWSYSDLMPKISIGNIGVVPILQMLILPLLVFKLTALKIFRVNNKINSK